VWLANRALGAVPGGERVVSNVVLMGMGEPLLNFEATAAALKLIGRRGCVRALAPAALRCRLRNRADDRPCARNARSALAVSLHAPNDALRDRLMPINRK